VQPFGNYLAIGATGDACNKPGVPIEHNISLKFNFELLNGSKRAYLTRYSTFLISKGDNGKRYGEQA
jgi:hypothetical protein